MPIPTLAERRARLRHLLMLREPALWPHWPFLPVVRRTATAPECGLLVDVRRVCGRFGYSATVFRTNLLSRPSTAAALMALPKEIFDTADEIYAAGWRVD
jgi:hypothetical protein